MSQGGGSVTTELERTTAIILSHKIAHIKLRSKTYGSKIIKVTEHPGWEDIILIAMPIFPLDGPFSSLSLGIAKVR